MGCDRQDGGAEWEVCSFDPIIDAVDERLVLDSRFAAHGAGNLFGKNAFQNDLLVFPKDFFQRLHGIQLPPIHQRCPGIDRSGGRLDRAFGVGIAHHFDMALFFSQASHGIDSAPKRGPGDRSWNGTDYMSQRSGVLP